MPILITMESASKRGNIKINIVYGDLLIQPVEAIDRYGSPSGRYTSPASSVLHTSKWGTLGMLLDFCAFSVAESILKLPDQLSILQKQATKKGQYLIRINF